MRVFFVTLFLIITEALVVGHKGERRDLIIYFYKYSKLLYQFKKKNQFSEREEDWVCEGDVYLVQTLKPRQVERGGVV